jgi:hypothetical protein
MTTTIFEDIRMAQARLDEYEDVEPIDNTYNTDRDVTLDDQQEPEEETETQDEDPNDDTSFEGDPQIQPVEEDPHLVSMLAGLGDRMQGILDMEKYLGDLSSALAAYKQGMAERGTQLDPEALNFLMAASQLIGSLHMSLLDVEEVLASLHRDVLPGLTTALQGGHVEYDKKLGEWKIWGVTDPDPTPVPAYKPKDKASFTDDQGLPNPPRGSKPGDLVEVPNCRRCGAMLVVVGKSGTAGWMKCKCDYCGAAYFMRESRRRKAKPVQ